MANSEYINAHYGNGTNIPNPIFKQAISLLIDSGLYSDYLDPENLNNVGRESLAKYNNVSGNKNAIPLEVLVDMISRAIMIGYRDGFSQAGLPIDGASGIGFTPLEATAFTNLDIIQTTNVHEAIILLAGEINAIKMAIQAVVPVVPKFPRIPSTQLTLEI